MTENFPEKLHQWSVNNQKLQKFMPVLGVNLCEKFSKTLCKMQNFPVALKWFLNQLKTF